MMDNIVVSNEMIHDAKCRKKQSMIFKVDLEKAYNSVRWIFLFYMIRRIL